MVWNRNALHEVSQRLKEWESRGHNTVALFLLGNHIIKSLATTLKVCDSKGTQLGLTGGYFVLKVE